MKNNYSFQKTIKKLIIMSVVLVFSATNAIGQTAWGYVCGAVQAPGSTFTNGNLYDINLTTGAGTLLGAVNCLGGTSLFAGEFINGTFYALNNATQKLVTVTNTGACTEVGSLTGLAAGHTLSGLSHNPANGITYALSTNVSASVSNLYTINLNTGALTLVGSITGVGGGITLMISNAGVAFVIDIITDAIFPINLSTAVAGTGVALSYLGSPINLNFAQDADFGCNSSGQIVGVLYTGGGNGRLGTIDPVTGVFTQTAFLGAEVCAFSIDCTPPTICPPATVSITSPGLNAAWKSYGANDPYTFYYGVTNAQRLNVSISGGVGPYTYQWTSSGSPSDLLPRAYYPASSIDLFEPAGAVTITCTITDQGNGCQYIASRYFDWTDEYFCGKTGNTWNIYVCQNGVTQCVAWTTGRDLLRNNLATLGVCQTPLKTDFNTMANELILYPNPSNDQINLVTLIEKSGNGELMVLDIRGNVVIAENLKLNEGVFEKSINLNQLSAGNYILRLMTEDGVMVKRFQIVN